MAFVVPIFLSILVPNTFNCMPRTRLPLLDAIKGLGCMAIVLHHLAVYGPMSDVVHAEFPGIIDGLSMYACLAVQIFFVLAGFLMAAQIAPDGRAIAMRKTRKMGNWFSNSPPECSDALTTSLIASDKASSLTAIASPMALIWKRYRRLLTPFLFAVVCATLITAIVRPWFAHDSLSGPPRLPQLVAHALLIHDLVGVESLSAGAWYVAIDFQLFVATVLLTVLAQRAAPEWQWVFPCLIIALAAGSLWVINRHDDYEDYAPYFFGAYALGMLAYWSTRPFFEVSALFVIASLGAVALWLEYRNPITVALASACIVGIAGQRGWLARWPRPGLMTWLGQRSYSIFLIHYGVCIGINAVWSHFFPTGLLINAVGMLVAVAVSIGAGEILYRSVESQPDVLGFNRATGMLVCAAVVTMLIETMAS